MKIKRKTIITKTMSTIKWKHCNCMFQDKNWKMLLINSCKEINYITKIKQCQQSIKSIAIACFMYKN
jgi:hypothetical protein